MYYKLIITDDADNDIENAMDWYENKQKRLGKKYLLSVKACTKLIVKNPFAFAAIYIQIRKANTKKFPYSLYFSINEIGKEIIVFAVIHNSRSEKNWKKRIDD